jgi:hypothetical protein
MKKNLLLLMLTASMIVASLVSCGSTKTAEEKGQKAMQIMEKVKSGDFTFTAQSVNPMRFSPVHLTSTYDLKISKDTVTAYLPYFGRAYVAPMNPNEGGIKFTSTKFEYKVLSGKRKGNWTVKIITHDTDRSFSLYLNIWDNGSAQLIVNDPNRQSISFDGYIAEP